MFVSAVDENLQLFKEMIAGTEKGLTYCLRAKIDYKSDNGCLRDPVMYRCRLEEHLIHGNKYVYVYNLKIVFWISFIQFFVICFKM